MVAADWSAEDFCHEKGDGIPFSCSDLANEREIAKNERVTRTNGSVLVIRSSNPLVKLMKRPGIF